MAQFSNITIADFARGIHARTGENKIPEGFVEDLLNMDAIGQQLRKRTGYEGYAGAFPHRVASMTYTASNDEIKLTFDGIVDLSSTGASPLIVYGRSSNLTSGANGGDFGATDALEYYPTFTPEVKDTLSAPSGTLTKTLAQRPISDTIYITQVAEATGLADNSWEQVYLSSEQQIQADDSLELDYAVGSDTDVYVYYVGKTAVAGTIYVDDTLSLDVNGQASITAATHQLNNYNITAYFYADNTTDWERIYPTSLTINQASGQVDVEFTGLASIDVRVILTAMEGANTITSGTTVGSVTTFTLSSPTSPWVMMQCFEATGGVYSLVEPDVVEYDASADEINVSFTGLASATIFYEYGEIAANSLTLTSNSNITSDGSDTSPQLTVWGLGHEDGIYGGTKVAREGWVTHIDSYRRTAEDRLVAALGGSLYNARTRTESGSTYGLPSLYPSLRSRTGGSNRIIGPVFYATGSTPARSQGYITATGVANNSLSIESITYNSGTGYVDVLLNAPSVAYLDSTATPTTLAAIINEGIDQLTLSGTSYPRNSGSFTIEAVAETSSSTFTLSISNSSNTSSLWNETDVGGSAKILTDKLITSDNSLFIPGDIVSSTALSSSLTCILASSTDLYVSGVTSTQTVEANVRITGSRTSKLIPLRDSAGNRKVFTDAMAGFVKGDTVSCTGASTDYNVKYVNSTADDAVTLSDNGTTLTISAVVDTGRFSVGQRICLAQAGDYSGIHIITSIASATSLAVASVVAGSGSGTLVGYTVELDDNTLVWTDSSANATAITVDRRWIPVEGPDASGDLPATTHTYYFTDGTVDDRPFIRSTIVNNNMYFTTGEDAVMKFDGSNVYRAGFFRWQPEAFLTQDTTYSGGTIPITTNIANTVSGVSGSRFTIPVAHKGKFDVGDRIEHSQNNERYTIIEIEEDGIATPADIYIKVDKAITGSASGTLSTVQTFSYYFRLNAFDVNSNIIASAITGSQDYRIEMGADAAVEGRLIGFPVWDIYDYDRIELEVYRSAADVFTEYRRVAVIPGQFDAGTGYFDFIDTTSDEDWSYLPIDPPSESLLGGELGITWTEPLRAKYISSADNRLLLANVKSYPRLDIQIVNETDEPTAAVLAGDIWHFKRQNTLTNSTTDMLNQIKYEFRLASDSTPITNILSSFDFVDGDVTVGPGAGADQIAETAHGLQTGDRIRLTTTGTLPSPLAINTDYFVIRIDANNFQLAASFANALAGTEIDITSAAGGGTHTLGPLPDITNNTGASFTVSKSAHGLLAGDWVYLYHSTVSSAHQTTYAGWWQIASATTNTFTINYTHSASYAPTLKDVDRYLAATAQENIPVLIDTDGNRDYVSGNTNLPKFNAMSRLAQAINASMRMVDTSIAGFETFTPWLIANAGGDYAAGQLIVEQPKVDGALNTGEAFELDLPSYTGYQVFVNGILKSASASVQAAELLFPSRLLISYPNYPELFDNPLATLPLESDSVIDVNPSDGQEITAIIPFFGESSFGGSTKEGVVVVFKTNSIYLVNVSAKAQGPRAGSSNPVQKIDSRGLGCTAPFSVAYTRNGIMFANESGIYRLTQNLTVDYTGDKMERFWQRDVNKDQLALAQGHHAARDNKYKLSVPIGSGALNNTQVYVYNHAQEVQIGEGAWSRYDSHEATGWVNLASEAFFASVDGRVFKVRADGVAADFRDDNGAITATATLRAEDFGIGGVRKLITKALIDLRIPYSFSSTRVKWATDMRTSFTTLPAFSATSGTRSVGKFRFDLDDARGTTFQLQITNNGLDEPLEITSVDYSVVGLSAQGTTKASEFSS